MTVVYYEGQPNSFLLVDNTQSTYIFAIDTINGKVLYYGIPEVDLFQDFIHAKRHISNVAPHHTEKKLGVALIGATVEANQLIILFITKVKQTAIIDNLPIYTIKEVDNLIIPINGAQITQPTILDFPIVGNHYFSHNFDLSITYPFGRACERQHATYWNGRWMSAFGAGSQACVTIFQGLALSLHPKGNDTNITYLIRRSALNPGTRYIARGINEECAPANECLCDLIVTFHGKSKAVSWARGSAPVVWSTVLKSAVATPQHIVGMDSVDMTSIYFGQLLGTTRANSVIILSLLHADGSEHDLYEKYKDAAERVSNAQHQITFHNLDINKALKEGPMAAMSQVWEILEKETDENDFSNYSRRQEKIVRFNCADSLDRTNVATFYYALLEVKRLGGFEGSFTAGLTQEAVDFLAKAFMESGDIVSALYTNTKAIKSSAILAMSSLADQAKNDDTAITLLRRFHNLYTDQARMSLIEAFTKDPQKRKGRFMIGAPHAAVIEQEGGGALAASSILSCGAVFNSDIDRTVKVMFPEDLILCAVHIKLVPQPLKDVPDFTLSIGYGSGKMHHFFANLQLPSVEVPTTVRYDLRKLSKTSLQYPTEKSSLLPGRFIVMAFSTHASSFAIGNIQLEVKNAKNRNYYFIQGKNFNPNYHDFNTASINSITNFETYRLTTGVNDSTRNTYLVKNGINPALFDFKSRLTPKPFQCSFCGKTRKLENYAIRPPCFVNACENGPIQLCPKCSSNAIIQTPQVDNIGVINQKKPQLVRRLTDFREVRSNIAEFGRFYAFPPGEGDPNSLLGNRGFFKFEKPKNRKKEVFELCFPAHANIRTIEIEMDDYNYDVEFSLEKVSESDKGAVLKYNSSTMVVKFTVRAERPMILRKVSINGNFIAHGAVPFQYSGTLQANFLTFPCVYDPSANTQVFKFNEPIALSGVRIEGPKSDGRSIIIGLYNSNFYVDSVSLIVPTCDNVKMAFPCQHARRKADMAIIFYLDRLGEPFDISFLF